MSGWTVAWLLWLSLFTAIEWPAICNKRKGDTLSEHVYRVFAVRDKPRWWGIRRAVLVAFLGWLVAHFLTGGEERLFMSDVLKAIAEPLLAALAPVIAGLIVAVLVQWLRKLGLEVGAEQQAKVEKSVQDVILSVEEWSARKRSQGETATSTQKLDRAVEQLGEKLPAMTTKAVMQLVDQELPKVKLGATVPGFQPAPMR